MSKIVVTGGSGKAGRVVVRDLLAQGHEVRNVDRVPSPESFSPDTPAPFMPADLTEPSQTLEALDGAEVIVHFAAIPSPLHATPGEVFRINVQSTYTVFAAARRLGIGRVMWASSETTVGFPFDQPPMYVPVDEEHVRLESSYALSKILGEEMARQFSRWTGATYIGLRLSNVLVRADYERLPEYWEDPQARKWNLWSYVDERHVADSVRCALDADVDGADTFIIAAPDTIMRQPSRELMHAVFPGVPVPDQIPEHGSLLSSDKARRVLGYNPQWTWRDEHRIS
jgi:nucleoside-diphosphate-sugar epimerase